MKSSFVVALVVGLWSVQGSAAQCPDLSGHFGLSSTEVSANVTGDLTVAQTECSLILIKASIAGVSATQEIRADGRFRTTTGSAPADPTQPTEVTTLAYRFTRTALVNDSVTVSGQKVTSTQATISKSPRGDLVTVTNTFDADGNLTDTKTDTYPKQ